MRRDSSCCAEFVRYNIFTNGAPIVLQGKLSLLHCENGILVEEAQMHSKFTSSIHSR